VPYLVTYLNHRASELMAERHRFRDRAGDAPKPRVSDVGATDATRADFQQHVMGSDLRLRYIVDSKVSGAVDLNSFHGRLLW
jgi:hypothetical protein